MNSLSVALVLEGDKDDHVSLKDLPFSSSFQTQEYKPDQPEEEAGD